MLGVRVTAFKKIDLLDYKTILQCHEPSSGQKADHSAVAHMGPRIHNNNCNVVEQNLVLQQRRLVAINRSNTLPERTPATDPQVSYSWYPPIHSHVSPPSRTDQEFIGNSRRPSFRCPSFRYRLCHPSPSCPTSCRCSRYHRIPCPYPW